MTPDEVMRLRAAEKEGKGGEQRIVRAGDMLIFVSGMYPIYGRQTLYFQDPVLLQRSQMPLPPTKPSDAAVVIDEANVIEGQDPMVAHFHDLAR